MEKLTKQLGMIRSKKGASDSSHCKMGSGDRLDEFVIVDKLGSGRFSTVYLANTRDKQQVAIKVYRAGKENTKYYENEIKMLLEADSDREIGVVKFLGTFAHVEITNKFVPKLHPCVVFERMGDHLGRLLRNCKTKDNAGLPLPIVKKIMRGLLGALAKLHSKSIIHTDVKPENILLSKKVESINGIDDIEIKLADLGSSTPASDLFSYNVGTTQYLAPELILEVKYTTAVDIWAAFSLCYELITGDVLFDVYDECDMDYGDRTDILVNEDTAPKSLSEMSIESPGEEEDPGTVSHDHSEYSNSSSSEDLWNTNYKHLVLMEKFIGPAPKCVTNAGREYFNARGKLKYNPNIVYLPIRTLLHNNYHLDKEVCRSVEKFLLMGLHYDPNRRITATEALKHPFLKQ